MPFYWRQHSIKQIDLSLSFVALYCKGCEIFNYSRPVMGSIIDRNQMIMCIPGKLKFLVIR